MEHQGLEFNIWELQIGTYENTRNLIATVSMLPVWSSNDEVIYFVKDDEPSALYSFEPLTSTVERQSSYEEAFSSLRISSDGLLATTESGAELLYIPLSKQFVETNYDCLGKRIIVCEQYDLIISPEGTLYYRWIGSNDAVLVAENIVVAAGYQDNEIFYVQRGDNGTTLNAYFVSEEETEVLANIETEIYPQLTVSADYAFILDRSGVVYRYDISVKELSAYAIIELSEVKNPLISVFDYRLMVYDFSNEINCTFVESMSADKQLSENEESDLAVAIYSIPQQTTESEYETLSMGNMGEGVTALQAKLYQLGYLSEQPSGFYGYETALAIQYLQADLGYNETGVADGALLSFVMGFDESDEIEHLLVSGSTQGINVRDIQARLLALNYTNSIPNGKMDSVTTNALSSFAKNNEIDYSAIVDENCLLALYADQENYVRYFDCCFGDSNENIAALNLRLQKLGYLQGSVLPTFAGKTETALSAFAIINEITRNEKECTAELQKYIFSDNAKICTDVFKPIVSLENASEVEGQVISDRQVKVIRKWLTKQFAVNHTERQAIKRLQKQLVRMGYLSEDNVTMIYDQDTFDAIAAFQGDNGEFQDGIASKAVLTKLWEYVIMPTDTEE